ncbi:hypothetical protein [Labilibaculum sp.]|uniref:hypothetical protein n=1 Tax=Labilibaculum sp. TaxID=2060723 RepID=UPI0035629B8D
MDYTIILKKVESALLWIFNAITNKFTAPFSKLKDKFPIIDRSPLLKYSLIPVLIALFFLLRYIIKFLVNGLAAWTSNFVGESAGYSISEKTIVLCIAAVFIGSRIILKLINKKKENSSK